MVALERVLWQMSIIQTHHLVSIDNPAIAMVAGRSIQVYSGHKNWSAVLFTLFMLQIFQQDLITDEEGNSRL